MADNCCSFSAGRSAPLDPANTDLPPHQGLRGAITDDTQMTLFTAAVVNRPGFTGGPLMKQRGTPDPRKPAWRARRN